MKTAGHGLGDAWSASVAYESPAVIAGIAYDKAIPSNFLGRGLSMLQSQKSQVVHYLLPRIPFVPLVE